MTDDISKLPEITDRCQWSKRLFKDQEKTVIGLNKKGRLITVAACHANVLDRVVMVGFYSASQSDNAESWKADDREWFENHPGRTHRIRKEYPGEFPNIEHHSPYKSHVKACVVRQVEPGDRFKQPVSAHPFDLMRTDDEFLSALFDRLQSGPGPKPIYASEINRENRKRPKSSKAVN